MLDQITHDGESADLRHNQAIKLTENDARDYLAKITGKRPLVRELALTWGWSKSTVARFLENLGQERDNAACPTPHQFRDLLINGTEDFDNKNPPETAEAAVDRALAEGKLKAPPRDDEERFDWSNDNPDIAVRHEPALAIYANPSGDIVIRRDCVANCEDDHFVFFSVQRAAAVVAGIQRVIADLEADK